MDDPIRDTLATYPQVAYALLFGSNATDRGTSFSDIDIAIGLRPGARLERQALGRLVSDLERVARAGRRERQHEKATERPFSDACL
jgi:predicted nucleotidyltransferase